MNLQRTNPRLKWPQSKLWRVLLVVAARGLLLTLAADGATAEPGTDVKASLDWFTLARASAISHSQANPKNSRFRLPTFEALSELRPYVKVDAAPTVSFVARPVLRATARTPLKRGDGTKEAMVTEAFFNELYGSTAFGTDPSIAVSYGIQNVQWGPAELTSPSNPIFRDLSSERSYFLHARGKELWRTYIGFGKSLSFTVLGETGSAKAAFGEPKLPPFESKLVSKVEWTSHSGATQLAAVAAARERSTPFLGGFAQLYLLDGVSIYADGGYARGSRTFFPAATPADGFVSSKDVASFHNFNLITGLRTTLTSGTDVRFEYFAQADGWSKDELRGAHQVIATPTPRLAEHLTRYASPGTLLPGRRYIYVSIREPAIPLFATTEVALRTLISLTDSSVRAFAAWQSDVGDSVRVQAAVSGAFGKDDLELTRDARWSATLGHSFSW